MSLYRNYRPKTLTDVIGQDHITETLAQAMEQKKISHAYLFAGVRGTGKTSTARILAGTLLTEGIEDESIRSQILKGMEEGNLVDLIEIDAASNRGIDDIRGLIEKIQFTPVVANAKVYIIDEAHMLTREAFNALLKTLEEPPEYAYFILATTELHKIPATIQSRCQRFLFRHIKEEHLVSRLRYIAEQEKISVADNALGLIAHHVQGGMRDAISLLDQLRSLPSITVDAVKERVGESGHEYATTILDAMNSGDAAAIVTTVHALEEAGVPLEHFVRLLLRDVRTAMHERVKNRQSPQRETQIMNTLLTCAKDLRSAPVQGLVLEAALLSLCNLPESDRSTSAATSATDTVQTSRRDVSTAPKDEIQATRRDVSTAPKDEIQATRRDVSTAPRNEAQDARRNLSTSTEPTADVQKPIEQVVSAPANDATGLSLASVRSAWPTIVDSISPASARMSLKNGQVHRLHGTVVEVVFSSSFHKEKAQAGDTIRSVNDALSSAIGTPVTVQFKLDADIHAPSPLPESDQVDIAAAALDMF